MAGPPAAASRRGPRPRRPAASPGTVPRGLAGPAVAEAAPLDRLGVDRELLGRWMRDLSADGLVEANGAGWRLTERGRLALASGAYTATAEERRTFLFRGRGRPRSSAKVSGAARADGRPGAAVGLALRRRGAGSLRRSAGRVEGTARLSGGRGGLPRAARTEAGSGRLAARDPGSAGKGLTCLHSIGEEGARRWLGFTVRPEDWVLQTKRPP